ncbi:Holliday junction branch migration protein RuvA [Candidatus Collierbacteria bacterium]|nr:Holliday junction branch migration protein RuvA [Candidatus Collierbacteria bacterium]
MIGFLSGIVKKKKNGQAIIFVNGVGYQVHIGNLQGLSMKDPVELYIHTHVREDAITLYGFKDESSLNLFEKLLDVSGIGPKSALAIITSGPVESIKSAIENTNLNFFTAIPGIGKKGAQKIIIELKSKIGKEVDLKDLEGNTDLKEALIQLGFKNTEILSIVPAVDISQPLNNQIKQALQLLKS